MQKPRLGGAFFVRRGRPRRIFAANAQGISRRACNVAVKWGKITYYTSLYASEGRKQCLSI